MSNQWLRVWHDMPNDPKWRTIARASKQRIPEVIAVYLHLLVDASANATERGRTQSTNAEDIASALDLESDQVQEILDAMQGRVLDGDRLTGWERRQPAREDGSAERAKAWREQKKAKSNAPERDQTQANAPERQEEIREEEIRREKEEAKTKPTRVPRFDAQAHLESLGVDRQAAADWITLRKSKKATPTETAIKGVEREASKAGLSLDDAVRECCSRGWGGFKAEWMANAQVARSGPGATQQERIRAQNEETARRFLDEVSPVLSDDNVIEMES